MVEIQGVGRRNWLPSISASRKSGSDPRGWEKKLLPIHLRPLDLTFSNPTWSRRHSTATTSLLLPRAGVDVVSWKLAERGTSLVPSRVPVNLWEKWGHPKT